MSSPLHVIVVGGGIVGCAVAYELAQRGASVQVVDARAIGMGATQASAGILAPYKEAAEDSPLFELTVRSLSLYDEFIQRVASDSGMTIAYRRSGTLDVAPDEPSMRELQGSAEALKRRGVGAELLDAAAVRTEEPQVSRSVAGGLLIGVHGFVSASDLIAALRRAAGNHGAEFVEHRRVARITKVEGRMAVDTDGGALGADAVVLAAGSWSGSIDTDALVPRAPLVPVRGQLLHLSWTGPRLRRVLWSPRCYLVPWDDGTVLAGATSERAGFDERTTVEGIRMLMDAACALTPNARTAGFTGARVGLRPGTADDLPIVGASKIGSRLMYATGHYRNGVLLSPITARFVAEALLEQRSDPAMEPFSPSRFSI